MSLNKQAIKEATEKIEATIDNTLWQLTKAEKLKLLENLKDIIEGREADAENEDDEDEEEEM